MATLTLTPKGFRASLPSGLPDLIVQSVSATPAAPNTGDHVVFSAAIKNQGGTATPADVGIGILFSIDGNPVNWTTDSSGPLEAGGTRTLTAANGASGAAYWVATFGTHTLLVNVNDTLTISETVTVNNTASSNVSVTSPTPPPGGLRYGPDGTEWSPNTVSDGTTFDVIVNSLSTLNTALGNVTTAQANAGYRIGLADGTDLAPSGSGGIVSWHSALHAADQAVLVRAVNPGQATNTATLHLQASNVALGYLGLGAPIKLESGGGPMKNSSFWRCYGRTAAAFVTAVDSGGMESCGFTGVIFKDRIVSDADRLHVAAFPSSAKPPNNLYVTRCWIEGIDDAGTGSHTDTAQWTCMLGVHAMTNTYFGAAGINGTSQMGREQQNGFAPYGTYKAKTCFYGGDTQTHPTQGNATSAFGPDIRDDCEFYNVSATHPALRINVSQVGIDSVITNSKIYGSISGSLTSESTGNQLLTHAGGGLPTFVKPPWAWW